MFAVYIGYQLLQIRCFLALRMNTNKNVSSYLRMTLIYTLNVFSNYGIWLVFASHRDAFFDVTLVIYGAVLLAGVLTY